MNESQLKQLERFADEFGIEYDAPSPIDKIWSYCVGFLASLGFIFALVCLGLWWMGAFK